MLYIDLKYIKLASSRLLNFKDLGGHRFRFRCPLCGDSKKSSTLARGNITPISNGLVYKCFNCGEARSLQALLDRIDPSLKREYLMEKLKNQRGEEAEPIFKKEVIKLLTDSVLDGLIGINELERNSPVIHYIKGRKIPDNIWHRFYYTETFKTFVNSVLPGKFKNEGFDHPRLILPYFNNHGKVIGVIGRSLDSAIEPKYLTIRFDNDYDMVYGLDTVNYGRRVYVVEGPIDSLFIPNSLAVSGTGFDNSTISRIKSNSTIIIDNEPRNKQIVKIVEGLINKGYTLCLFPESFKFKDINQAIEGGYSVDKIMNTIDSNTYFGLKAKIRFTSWRKCNGI